MNETDHLFPSSYAPNTSASFILIEIRGEMSDLPFADLCGSAQAPLAAIKLPGTLQLAALAIEDCQFAALLLLDCTSQVTVDACHDCILFIGPCKGSVFIRDCSNCTIFIVSRQLRFRGCSDCRVFPFTASGPIIESSSNMVFQCFGSSYLGLLDQLGQTRLSPYANNWSRVYDFTPDPDPSSLPHFSLAPSSQQLLLPFQLTDLDPSVQAELQSAQFELQIPQLPVTAPHTMTRRDQLTHSAAIFALPATVASLQPALFQQTILALRLVETSVLFPQRQPNQPADPDAAYALVLVSEFPVDQPLGGGAMVVIRREEDAFATLYAHFQ